MYLKCHSRNKDDKTHRYWSVAEHVHGADGRRFERHVLYLGEISDSQRDSWERRISVFDEERGETRQMSLFPADRRGADVKETDRVRVVLSGFSLRRPRQWGACWAFHRLWEELELDRF